MDRLFGGGVGGGGGGGRWWENGGRGGGRGSRGNVGFYSWSGWGVFLILLFGELVTESKRTGAGRKEHGQRGQGCHFPSDWEGIWFQSTVRPYITIQNGGEMGVGGAGPGRMSNKGVCVRSQGEKYILKEGENCFKCVVFHQKARNVLQYKETFGCAPSNSFSSVDSLCGLIAGDANLYSLFRVDGSPIACPFRGNFQFTYDRGKGECKWPMSETEGCTQQERMVFQYQACHNVDGSEMMTEELECQATWKDGSFQYLVGKISHLHASTDEDKFRCFVFDFFNPLVPSEGLRLAQSGDATCNGLFSPTEGSRTMTLKRAESKVGCRFPRWLSSVRLWVSLDDSGSRGQSRSRLSLSVSEANTSFIHLEQQQQEQHQQQHLHHLLHRSRGQDGRSWNQRLGGVTSVGGVDSLEESSSSRVLCHRREEQPFSPTAQAPTPTRVILYQTVGCRNGFVCAELRKKTDTVMQLKMGKLSRTADYACDSVHFGAKVKSVILVAWSPGLPPRRPSHWPTGTSKTRLQQQQQQRRKQLHASSSSSSGSGSGSEACPFSGLYRISNPFLPSFAAAGSSAGGGSGGDGDGDGDKQPQLSAAVRSSADWNREEEVEREAEQQLLQRKRDGAGTVAVADKGQVDPATFCLDGTTRREASLVMGCGPDKADMEVRTTCQEDVDKGFTCTHKWTEGKTHYLIFQSKTSSPSINDRQLFCFAVQFDSSESEGDGDGDDGDKDVYTIEEKAPSPPPHFVRMVQLNANCQSERPLDERANKSYSSFTSSSFAATAAEERGGDQQMLLTLQGDCSQVSAAAPAPTSAHFAFALLFSLLGIRGGGGGTVEAPTHQLLVKLFIILLNLSLFLPWQSAAA